MVIDLSPFSVCIVGLVVLGLAVVRLLDSRSLDKRLEMRDSREV